MLLGVMGSATSNFLPRSASLSVMSASSAVKTERERSKASMLGSKF